jgi:hypothetical protein
MVSLAFSLKTSINSKFENETYLSDTVTYIRASVFKEYLQKLNRYIETKEIAESAITNDKLARLNDSFLLGNSSERIAGQYINIFAYTFVHMCVCFYIRLTWCYLKILKC